MDLSNFSKSLPLSIEPTDDAINTLNKEISDEFKCGARSIAALYRLSNTKNQLLMAKGYLDCLNDLSKLIDSEKLISIEDLKDFIRSKRNDFSSSSLERVQNIKPEPTEKANEEVPKSVGTIGANDLTTTSNNRISIDVQPPLTDIDDSYKFTISHPSNHHFPKSRVPLSIDHSNLKCFKSTKQSKKISDHSSEEEVEDTDNEPDQDGSDLSFDEITNSFSKRKPQESILTAHKKPKI